MPIKNILINPSKIKSLLNNIDGFQIPNYSKPPWSFSPISNFNRKVDIFREYYPKSLISNKCFIPIFQMLIAKNKNKSFETILLNFHPKFKKYDFNKLRNIYLLYNPPKSDSELEAIFSLFYHLRHGTTFEEYFRKEYEANLRKSRPFLKMVNYESLWEKFFPNAKISQFDKKRIEDNFNPRVYEGNNSNTA